MFLVCLICATCVASAADAQSSIAERTRVQVSRREARIEFPRDTARTWGWVAKAPDAARSWYVWAVGIEGVDGPQSITLDFYGVRGTVARSFSSLRDLIALRTPALCSGAVMVRCDESHVSASVENGALVMVLRDSTTIARLFGLRPTHVTGFRRLPDDTTSYPPVDSVRVEYVAPMIGSADSALKAEAALARRRLAAQRDWTMRSMDSRKISEWGVIALTIGDTTSLFVRSTRCSYDVCAGGAGESIPDTGWVVDDPSVAELRANVVSAMERRGGYPVTPPFHLRALRAGSTTVRLRGLPIDPNDELAGREPRREVSLPVLVTAPVERPAGKP